jgi:two-component system KDP operon response regulator KdpE
VIRRVRVLFPNLPVIVLSARGEDAAKVEALDLGADDYVSKPFPVGE